MRPTDQRHLVANRPIGLFRAIEEVETTADPNDDEREINLLRYLISPFP